MSITKEVARNMKRVFDWPPVPPPSSVAEVVLVEDMREVPTTHGGVYKSGCPKEKYIDCSNTKRKVKWATDITSDHTDAMMHGEWVTVQPQVSNEVGLLSSQIFGSEPSLHPRISVLDRGKYPGRKQKEKLQ